MKRTVIRKHVFMILFRVEFYKPEDMTEQEQLYFERAEGIEERDRQYISERVKSILEVLPEIDGKLESVSKGWKIDRLGKAELAILRLGIFELLFDNEVPTNVALNEAVELAKQFGGDSSPSFINGVLAKLVQ